MNVKVLSTAIALLLTFGSAQAYDFVSGGVYYNILSNTTTRKTAAVTYRTTNSDASGFVSTYKGNVVIPAQTNYQMQTFNVTQIGDLAMFNNQSLYSLTLPEGIYSIGSQAFSHCYSLYEVNIPSTVGRIADYAFEYCEDLTHISLPATLAEFGEGVFQQCFGLESINVDEDCLYFKSMDGVLYSDIQNEEGMTLKVYPAGKLSQDFVMPDNVRILDGYALSGNLFLKNLTLSKDLNRIGELSFIECQSLEGIYVPDDNSSFISDEGVLLTADGSRLIYYPLARLALSYEIPKGVERIDMTAFYQTKVLQNITLPSTLTHIGELAFFQDKSFRKVTCKALTPPSWDRSAMHPSAGLFDQTVYSQATLYVPKEAIEAYQKDAAWGRFSKIMPINNAGIDSTSLEEEVMPTQYFDIHGNQLAVPGKGVNIVKKGSKVSKRIFQ